MLNSWQIPMMILVTKGLYNFIAPVIAQGKLANRKIVVIVFVLAVLPTNVYLWAWRFVDLARHDYAYYLHRDDMAGLDWLRQNTVSEDIVISSLTIGQYIPAISGNTAFLAHWAQTVGFYDKRGRVARFFDATVPDEERVETVYVFGVDYVFHGPAEHRLGSYDPATAPWLELAFSAPRVDVYRVEHGRLSLMVDSGGDQ
jgi:hypothetical protein